MHYKDFYSSREDVDKYIKNTLVSLAGIVPELKESMLVNGLTSWSNECRTEFCFGGWCANTEYFEEQGLRWEYTLYPEITNWIELGSSVGSETAEKLFGNCLMFYMTGCYYRPGVFSRNASIDDKAKSNLEIIKNRLEDHLDFLLSLEGV